MALLASGDTVPRPANAPLRKRWQRWNGLYEARYDTSNDAAPSYVRGWGRIVAGMFQARPIRYTDDIDSPAVTVDTLADLTDDGVKRSAGEGVAFVRFVRNLADEWVPLITAAQSVDATWRNNQMVDAVVYAVDIGKDKNTAHVYLEEYGTDPDVPFRVSVWEARKRDGGWVLGTEVDPESTTFGTVDETPRPLIPAPWAFEDGDPVPLYVGNEQAVYGLARLWTQEQEDAEITRRRLAVSDKMVSSTEAYYGRTDNLHQLGRARFKPRDNVLLLPSGGSATDPSLGGIEQLEFSDDITMRERIERRENGLLEQIGISPQSIGRMVSGRSDSAAAKRADQQLTLTTIGGPARRWQAVLNRVVEAAAALGAGDAGFVDVREGLREPGGELAETAQAGLRGESMSTQTRVKLLNPTQTDEWIEEETARVLAEYQIVSPTE